MYPQFKRTTQFETLQARFESLTQAMARRLADATQAITVNPNTDLAHSLSEEGGLAFVTEGMLACTHRGKVLFYYEKGDAIRLETSGEEAACQISSELAVRIQYIRRDNLMNQLTADRQLAAQWHQLTACHADLLICCLSALIQQEDRPQPEVRMIPAGTVILREGSDTDDVLTLIGGRADVFMGDAHVGQILPDETFGAIAALTDTLRTASVVATTDCMVLSLPKRQLLQLIETKPNTALKLITDMARVIVNLNQQVAATSDPTVTPPAELAQLG